MIVNDKYNFLFIHIQKTAGTSVTDMLNKIKYTQKEKSDHSFITCFSGDLSSYFKFCFVRNPWERLVSWYNMMIQKGIHNDFSRYILENSNNFSEFLNLTDIITENNACEIDSSCSPYLKSISFNQLDYISDDTGEILVDFIGRFENLKEDYEKICEKIGVKLYLPHENKFSHKSYREYYKNEKDIEKVYFMYKRDIDFFCYEF